MIATQQFKKGHAGVFQFTNGETTNYGVIRTETENLVYYTGKGLREMYKPNMSEAERVIAKELLAVDEKDLILSQHIAVTPLSEIAIVLS